MKRPWKMMTDEQKARNRERCRKYSKTPNGREKALERKRRWNAKNLERKREQASKWYEKNKDDPAFKANRYAVAVEWRKRNADHVRAYSRSYRELNLEKAKSRLLKFRMKLKIVLARDAAKYALWREKQREKHRMKVERQGRVYIPRPNIRIPDYIPFGVGYDFAARSNFLRENIGNGKLREMDCYASDLRIERNGKRGAA